MTGNKPGAHYRAQREFAPLDRLREKFPHIDWTQVRHSSTVVGPLGDHLLIVKEMGYSRKQFLYLATLKESCSGRITVLSDTFGDPAKAVRTLRDRIRSLAKLVDSFPQPFLE